jgi:hypothetical protein
LASFISGGVHVGSLRSHRSPFRSLLVRLSLCRMHKRVSISLAHRLQLFAGSYIGDDLIWWSTCWLAALAPKRHFLRYRRNAWMANATSGTKVTSIDADKHLVDDMMARYARLARQSSLSRLCFVLETISRQRQQYLDSEMSGWRKGRGVTTFWARCARPRHTGSYDPFHKRLRIARRRFGLSTQRV